MLYLPSLLGGLYVACPIVLYISKIVFHKTRSQKLVGGKWAVETQCLSVVRPLQAGHGLSGYAEHDAGSLGEDLLQLAWLGALPLDPGSAGLVHQP